MRHRKQSLLERLAAFFHHQDEHHRVCWRCHRPIKRNEHWHQIKVGWFAPFYTVEHRYCENTLQANPVQVVELLEPKLPFEEENPHLYLQKTDNLEDNTEKIQ